MKISERDATVDDFMPKKPLTEEEENKHLQMMMMNYAAKVASLFKPS